MREAYSRSWLFLVVRGVLAILFGILAFAWTRTAIVTLIILFGFYALIDGIVSIFSAFRNRQGDPRWWLELFQGLLGIAVGVLAILTPAAAAVVLLYFIAAWAITTGVLQIISAVQLRKEIDNEWSLGLIGVLSIGLGILLALNPILGLVTITWLIGTYAIVFGILLIVLGFRVRSGRRTAPIS